MLKQANRLIYIYKFINLIFFYIKLNYKRNKHLNYVSLINDFQYPLTDHFIKTISNMCVD